MKAKTIVAKIRNAVQVQLCVNGEPVKTYRNVELPESIKELEILDFGFDTKTERKITFQLNFAPGVLPTEFPEPRTKLTRAEITAAREKMQYFLRGADTMLVPLIFLKRG